MITGVVPDYNKGEKIDIKAGRFINENDINLAEMPLS